MRFRCEGQGTVVAVDTQQNSGNAYMHASAFAGGDAVCAVGGMDDGFPSLSQRRRDNEATRMCMTAGRHHGHVEWRIARKERMSGASIICYSTESGRDAFNGNKVIDCLIKE